MALVLAGAALPGVLNVARLNGCALDLAEAGVGSRTVVRAQACFAGAAGAGLDRLRLAAVSETRGSPSAAAPSDEAGEDLQAAAFAYRRGAMTLAAELYRDELARRPSSVTAWTGLGNALTCRVRQPWGYDPPVAGCQTDWPGAVDAFRHAVALGPSGDASMGLALAEQQAGQLAAAVGDMAEAARLAAKPEDRYYRNLILGDWQMALGVPRLAVQAYVAAASEGFPVSDYWRRQYQLALSQSSG